MKPASCGPSLSECAIAQQRALDLLSQIGIIDVANIYSGDKLMPRRCRHREANAEQGPCSCEMGNLYRFTEPIVLLVIANAGEAHGYQISTEAEQLAVTHAGLDAGAIYRVLRRLETVGHVTSHWETTGEGPARRVYTLTASGVQHLAEWGDVLEGLTKSLRGLTSRCRKAISVTAPVGGTMNVHQAAGMPARAN